VDGLASSDAEYRAATVALTSGPLAVPFWIRVVAGLLVPLALIAIPATRTVLGTGIAAGFAFVGVIVDRFLFVTAGQIVPTTTVGGVVNESYVPYAPSPVEIAIVVAAFAFVAFCYTLAERYLDLREAEVHIGILHVPAGARAAWTRLTTRPAPDIEPAPPGPDAAVGGGA
jgi:Ni/Fe-hydrogenase subunit HybB-like protein